MSDQSHKSRISEMVRYAVAIVILLAMVFLAVNSYQAITTMQNENNDFRKELSYLANKVRAADTTGAVEVNSGKYGDALVIIDNTESGAYETRIYEDDGILYEEYQAQGTEYNKELATKITSTDKYKVSKADNVISIETDSGKTIVSLRAEE
ncbi:MAG: DUF4860 domain-containing protein [Clostridiales bacterium]|nr:DUF4860 domain-containing protein [Clostridiales bacterium]